MKNERSSEIKEFFEAILALENIEECDAFFEDVCTVKEIEDIAQRLCAAKLLAAGVSYTEICRRTGMSTATISRVNRALAYGKGGYKLALARADKTKEEGAK